VFRQILMQAGQIEMPLFESFHAPGSMR